MPKKIKITAGKITAEATLAENRTAAAIWEKLPITGRARTWGEEIYFPIPLQLPPEDPQEIVERGDLGYWPPGRAFCIFFGPTPASEGEEIRPASAVNIIGRVLGDPHVFTAVQEGEEIKLEEAREK